MRFQRLDIVESAPGWRKDVFAITGIDLSRPQHPYTGINLLTRGTFYLKDEGLGPVRVGVADEGWLAALASPGPSEPTGPPPADLPMLTRGQLRARLEAQMTMGSDRARWEKLASLQPGDPLTIVGPRGDETVCFRHVNDRGKKYVFVATNINGTAYRYPLGAVRVSMSQGEKE